MASAAAIAGLLGATRQGRNWRAPCPCNCGYGLSFCDSDDGRLLAYCFGGCEFDQIMLALVIYGLLDGDDADFCAGQIIPHRDDDRRRNKIEFARAIYAAGVCDKRIGVYLRGRGLRLGSSVLRFTEQAPHRLGACLPAMLAPIVDVDGEQTGVHLTYLRPDGRAKADLPKEYQRETRGALVGGAIWLHGFQGDELILSEGIESGLAAAEIFTQPCWAAVYAGGLKSVVLPHYVTRVIIAADNDASGVGLRNALAAHARLVSEGRSVRIRCPSTVGDDFNDALIKMRGGDARH
jgi:phage/plasmid primase-like uncharacterized protein